jgi:hypothetical protein
MPNQIDLPRCTSLWTEQDVNLFNKLPIYMAKIQTEFIKYYSRWPKLLSGIPWQANMGTTMRGVSKRPAPIMRSQAFPQPITALPRKDVIQVREVTEDTILYRQDFESDLMHFLPNFQDFLTDHVDKTNDSLVEQIMVYNDQFSRTAIFHGAPKVWICGKVAPMTDTIYWANNGSIAAAKNQATMQALIAQCTETLTLRQLANLATSLYTDNSVNPYTGKVLADGTDGAPLKQKYCLLTASEVWDNFIHDPYLLANRPLGMNIITEGLFGSLFGRWTTMFERFELRVKDDGTFPAPETIEEGPNAYNRGEPIPNPDYVNCKYGIAFACGDEGYRSVKIGPPPKEWTGMGMKQFARLDWNGKVDITQNVMVNCADANGALVQDTNKRGEYLQLIASAAMGIAPVRRRNIVPIIYKRSRVGG